jgi:hypothetical protein
VEAALCATRGRRVSARHKRQAARGLHPILAGETAVLEADAITPALCQATPPLIRCPEAIKERYLLVAELSYLQLGGRPDSVSGASRRYGRAWKAK